MHNWGSLHRKSGLIHFWRKSYLELAETRDLSQVEIQLSADKKYAFQINNLNTLWILYACQPLIDEKRTRKTACRTQHWIIHKNLSSRWCSRTRFFHFWYIIFSLLHSKIELGKLVLCFFRLDFWDNFGGILHLSAFFQGRY